MRNSARQPSACRADGDVPHGVPARVVVRVGEPVAVLLDAGGVDGELVRRSPVAVRVDDDAHPVGRRSFVAPRQHADDLVRLRIDRAHGDVERRAVVRHAHLGLVRRLAAFVGIALEELGDRLRWPRSPRSSRRRSSSARRRREWRWRSRAPSADSRGPARPLRARRCSRSRRHDRHCQIDASSQSYAACDGLDGEVRARVDDVLNVRIRARGPLLMSPHAPDLTLSLRYQRRSPRPARCPLREPAGPASTSVTAPLHARRARHFARRTRDRLHVRRRHLAVPAAGGDARLLVADAATDRRPLFSPDGRQLAFISTRTGGGDIYVLTLATGDVRRLTWDDGLEQLDGWSRDGALDLFQLDEPRHRRHERRLPRARRRRHADAGDRRALRQRVRRGAVARRPAAGVRRARHRVESVVAAGAAATSISPSCGLIDARRATPAYTQLTPRDARQHVADVERRRPHALLRLRSRRRGERLARGPATRAAARDRAAHDVSTTAACCGRRSRATAARSRSSATSASGRSTRRAARRARCRSPGAARRRRRRRSACGRRRSSATSRSSPDGRKVAFVARGDVFAASARTAATPTRVTATPAIESQPVWAPDSRRLAYVSARGARPADLSLTTSRQRARRR